jgi:hypothetical protein
VALKTKASTRMLLSTVQWQGSNGDQWSMDLVKSQVLFLFKICFRKTTATVSKTT